MATCTCGGAKSKKFVQSLPLAVNPSVIERLFFDAEFLGSGFKDRCHLLAGFTLASLAPFNGIAYAMNVFAELSLQPHRKAHLLASFSRDQRQ